MVAGSDIHLYCKQLWQSCVGHELQYRDDDTCVGYGSHCRTPRHGNGGRHYKTYGAVASRRLIQPLNTQIKVKKLESVPTLRCGFCRIRGKAMEEEKHIPESTPSITVSIEGRTIELSFAESADNSIFDRLRQTLFQTYIQSLAYPY